MDQNTGEIRTKRTLDREVVSEYRFSAIPLNGEESIEVIVTVGDVNDNTPVFEVNEVCFLLI